MALRVATTASGQLAYIPETVAGETPTTGKGINLRMTGESFEQTISKEVSKEINATRQTAGMFLTDNQVSGGFQFELSAGEYDTLLEATLMDDWSTFGTNGATAAESAEFKAADKSITFTSNISSFGTLPVGAYILITGTGVKPKNAKPLRVQAVAGKKITVYEDLEDQTVADAVIHHRRLTNGVKRRSFSFEKTISDANQRFIYRGCQMSKFSLNFESKAAMTGSFEIIGMTAANGDTRMLGDRTDYNASQANPIIDAVLGMENVLLDGADIRTDMTAGVKKITLEYDNNMKGHDAIGVLGNVDVTAGVIKVSGNISMYFNKGSIYNEVIRQTRFNLSWKVYDRNGHGYAITLPSVELNSPKVAISDNDSPVMVELEYAALMDPTSHKTICIDRF